MLSDLIPHTVRKPARGWDCMEKAGKTPFRVPADRGRDLRFFRVHASMCNPKQIINECGAKSQFLTDKSESLMVLYKH